MKINSKINILWTFILKSSLCYLWAVSCFIVDTKPFHGLYIMDKMKIIDHPKLGGERERRERGGERGERERERERDERERETRERERERERESE